MANIKEVAKDNWRYRVRYKKNGVYKEVAKQGFKTEKEALAASIEVENRIKRARPYTTNPCSWGLFKDVD